MLRFYFFCVCFIFTIACSNREPRPTGDYFGFQADSTAQIFGAGLISKEYYELNSAFAPDGNEFYYSITTNSHDYVVILQYVRRDGFWEGPTVAPFSGSYSDADPFFTPDGKRLYFISQRPTQDSVSEPKDYDIWYVNREAGGWGDPINVGAPVNSERGEYYVSVTHDYTLYYSTNYEDPKGPGFVHKAQLVDGKYVVTKLGPAVNGTKGGGDPYISPDEKTLIFSSGREGGIGSADLYVSFFVGGEWTEALNMGPDINSKQYEYCPIMSPDGKYFFYTSTKAAPFHSARPKDYASMTKRLNSLDNQLGNVYWIKSDFLSVLRNKANVSSK